VTRQRFGSFIPAMLVVGSCTLTTLATAADPHAAAVIQVTDTVVATGIEPVGANLTTIAGGTNFAVNNFIWGGGFEPGVARYLIRVERSGPNWIEWDESEGGIHMWDQNATGYGNGATIRFYRLVDSAGQPLTYTGGLQNAGGADHVVFLGETTVPMPSAELPQGGWIAEGSAGTTNRVWLSDTLNPTLGDYAIITVTKTRLTAAEVHPRLHQWFEDDVNVFWHPDTWNLDLVPHPGTIPPAFTDHGDTCLEIVADSTDWVGQYIFHGLDSGEGQWYSQLEPGASYRVEVWLRQQGLPSGPNVRFISGGDYDAISQTTGWTVTGSWQKYTYDFIAPGYPSPSTFHQRLGLEITGPGTLWMDNFVVFRNDAAHGNRPFTPQRVSFDEMMAAMPATGPKPAIRFYPVIYHGHRSLDHLFSDFPSGHIDFIYNVGATRQSVTLPQSLEWALATGTTPATRAVPFITLSEEYTELEWMAVVEYLGVPYDPASDTPAAKPHAYQRYLRRGHGAPWTDDFREIILEMGNETWHNGAGGHGWHGFSRPGYVWFGGAEYGLFARHYFEDHVMQMPAWTEHDLGQKIHFSLNAGYDGAPDAYGELAAQHAPNATHSIGHANYVGPTWETGDTPHEFFDDHGMQETLVGMHTGMKDLIDEVAATRDSLAASGLADYEVVAYEGGPSGYALPGDPSVTPDQVANAELYGKSLGMGVAALDAWLYSSLNGYTHQCFLGFASGGHWTSHTMPRAGGFRRHAGWLALMLRNRWAPGTEMLDTTLTSVPTYDRSGEDVPLITAYTVKGRDTTSVFVLSRKLDGDHDGVDFGDGTTPVTIQLPFSDCTGLTRVALTAPDGTPADPRTNNITTENVVIDAVSLNPALCSATFTVDQTTGGVAGGMPPGTVYLYVFERSEPIFSDGFETGDTNAWTS
jgi:hypothetical protein